MSAFPIWEENSEICSRQTRFVGSNAQNSQLVTAYCLGPTGLQLLYALEAYKCMGYRMLLILAVYVCLFLGILLLSLTQVTS